MTALRLWLVLTGLVPLVTVPLDSATATEQLYAAQTDLAVADVPAPVLERVGTSQTG